MNMHSLIHLADDVKTTGCPLSEITAFSFENELGKMKKMLRSGRKPLAQLCRRLHEAFSVNDKKVTLPPAVTVLTKLCQTPTGIIPIKKLKFKGATISTKSPNNNVQLQNGKLLQINNMYIPPNGDMEDIVISGSVLTKKKPMFLYPCNSKTLNMWEVTAGQEIQQTWPLSCVSLKMVILNVSAELREGKTYAMPLLHL